MRLESRRRAAGITAAALLLAGATMPGSARAQEEDRAMSAFVRPTAPVARGQPVDARQWEITLRPADRFGPPVLRVGDAALLAAARAARWGDALELLKSHQAGANAQDGIGGHVLVLAARAGPDELVRELLKRGADTERVGEDGFTALGAAAFAGQRSTVRLLLRAGVDVERWGATGQTALHLAGVAGRVEVLQELLRARVNVELLNRQRESALDVAAAAGQMDAMQVLIEAGANLVAAGRR